MAAKVSNKTDRVLIVDDHPVMRGGLASLLAPEKNIEVVAEAGTIGEAMTAISEHAPTLVLADLRLPDGSGLEFIKNAIARWPRLRFLVVSMHDEKNYAERVLRAGGCGYVMKEEASDRLLEAIRRVLAGKIYVSDEVSQLLVGPMVGRRPGREVSDDTSPVQGLTDREIEVLELLGMGLGTRKISDRLGIGIKTVESHCANIKAKLHLADRSQLVSYAVRWVAEQ